MRVALATNFVSPYRIPLYTVLAETPGWELTIFTSCEKEFDRHWRPIGSLSVRFKRSFNISYKRTINHAGAVMFNDTRQIHLPLGLWFDLKRYQPDVVISGEMGARSLISAGWAHLASKPIVLWIYGTIHTERDINWKQKALRKVLSRLAQAFIGMGTGTLQYLESLGVASDAIFVVKNAIDRATFQSPLPDQQQLAVRNKLGISGLCYLYVGQLIPRKGIDKLLDAWEVLYKRDRVQASLVLVGDGDQKESLINQASGLGLDNVRFVGFIQPEKLPELYHAADVFVFPTLEDVWGLVVNEALSSGLPVICSKYAGCVPDLIIEGRNGWIVDPLDPTDMVHKLRIAWDARGKKEAMGRAGRDLILDVNIPRMAEGFRKAVEYALAN